MLWVCRAGSRGEFENYFLEKGVIALTWTHLESDLTAYRDKNRLKKPVEGIYPDKKPGAVSNKIGMADRFINQMKPGDFVLMPSKIVPGKIYLGTIESDCTYNPKEPNIYRHQRKVVWKKETISRSDLDQDILHTLGSLLSIYGISDDDKAKRILAVAKIQSADSPNCGHDEHSEQDDEQENDIENSAIDEITNRIYRSYKGKGMEFVVASILRAKGFYCLETVGADDGIDVLATTGPLGFGGLKICVQVKTGDAPIDKPVLHELQGAMTNVGADYGLLVSWNGFKTSYDKEKRDKFFTIRFWDHQDIVKEFLDNYEKLDERIREAVPLKRVWIPDVHEDRSRSYRSGSPLHLSGLGGRIPSRIAVPGPVRPLRSDPDGFCCLDPDRRAGIIAEHRSERVRSLAHNADRPRGQPLLQALQSEVLGERRRIPSHVRHVRLIDNLLIGNHSSDMKDLVLRLHCQDVAVKPHRDDGPPVQPLLDPPAVVGEVFPEPPLSPGPPIPELHVQHPGAVPCPGRVSMSLGMMPLPEGILPKSAAIASAFVSAIWSIPRESGPG